MIKFILLALVLYGIYFFFFRPKSVKESKREDKKLSQTMVQCPKCGVFVSSDEAIIKNGRYFCSRECITKA